MLRCQIRNATLSCFVYWLREWQDLVAGIVGAVALVVTVWVTLSRESRRRAEEIGALRTALGAELRQFARRALTGHTELASALHAAATIGAAGALPGVSLAQAENVTRFPEPIIYSRTANNIGTLGDYAHKVVVFYGQLSLIWENMRRRQEYASLALSGDEVHFLAVALLTAAGAAADALPAFAASAWVEKDASFTRQVAEAREAFAKLKPATSGEHRPGHSVSPPP
jgi:hypothetical protein